MRAALTRTGRARVLHPRRAPAQSIVEFGIVVVIFFFLIMGIFDFGMTMNSWIAVISSAREGARQAAIGATPGEVQALVQKNPFPGVDRSKGPINVEVFVRTACPTGCKQTSASDVWTKVTSSDYSSLPAYPDSTKPPVQGDQIKVRVTADYFELFTPAVRAAFGCPGSAANCYIPLKSETIVRYEGVFIK